MPKRKQQQYDGAYDGDGESPMLSPIIVIKRSEKEENDGVYVLKESPNGRFYVGKSKDVPARIREHMTGSGTTCCHFDENSELVDPITSAIYNSDYEKDLESWERIETLTRMYEYGIDKVRGWIFTAGILSRADKDSAFLQICERFDLCRRCGRATHFAGQCKAMSKIQWGERMLVPSRRHHYWLHQKKSSSSDLPAT